MTYVTVKAMQVQAERAMQVLVVKPMTALVVQPTEVPAVRAMQVLAVLVIRDQAERARNVRQSVNDLNVLSAVALP